MAQLSLGGNAQHMTAVAPPSVHSNYTLKQHHYDGRQRSGTPKTGGKYGGNKGYASCSSQNSTGTSSPATTVATAIAGYSGNASAGGLYGTQTPPLHPGVQMGYGPTYIPPVLCRQVSVNLR